MIGLVNWAADRARMVMAFIAISLLVGGFASVSLPTAGEPDIEIPALFISVSFPGISAEDSETLLVKVMETELGDLDGLDKMSATAAEGYAGVALEFDFGWDKTAIMADVRDAMDKAEAEFPEGAEKYSITEINFSEFPIVIVNLTGAVPERTMARIAKDLQDDLEALDAVLEAGIAGNRDEMVDKILRGYGTKGNDMPINAAYPLFDETIPQREHSIEKAKEHYAKSGHDGSPIVLRVADGAFPGAVDAASLFQESAKAAGIPLEIKREPNDGYWSEVWNKQPFCTSYWGGRPTQDQMFTTAYLSTADWNDTRFNNEQFDQLLLAARAELDTAKRTQMYADMGEIQRDEGGLICPMFNDFVDATSDRLDGWAENSKGQPLMNAYAPMKMWVKA